MKPFRIEIDKHRLDEEWVEQPALFHQHAVAAVEARAVWEQAKARLEVTKAEFDIEIRRDPESYEIPKLSETVIASAVASQKLVKDAVAAVIKAREEVGILEAAVSALEHRKKALEKLVELSTRDYYSEPKAKGEVMGEVEKRSIRRRGRRKKDDD